MPTSAAEILAVAFATLPAAEQEEAFARINDARLSRLADAEDESAFFVRSLRRVAELAEGELTPDVYRSRRRRLVADGEEVAEFNAVVRRFGSWSHASAPWPCLTPIPCTRSRPVSGRGCAGSHGPRRSSQPIDPASTLRSSCAGPSGGRATVP